MARFNKITASKLETRSLLRLEGLEAREVPASDAFDLSSITINHTAAVAADTAPELGSESTDGSIGHALRAVPRARYAVSTGAGSTTQVNVYDSATNAKIGTLTPFGREFTTGARVTTGDLTGDDIEDVVVAAAPGSAPWIKIYDGGTLAELKTFLAYDFSFDGGLFVATGDFDGDGRADMVTGAGIGGGPHVQIFNGKDLFPGTTAKPTAAGVNRESFFAYSPNFSGGVSVAAADIDGDGRDDVITGAGPGGGPHVQIFSGEDHHSIASFFAYEPTMSLGVMVTASNLAGDGRPEIVTAPMLGGAPIARAFAADGRVLADYTPFGTELRTGASVSAQDLDDDGVAEVIVATGPKTAPQVRVMSAGGATLREFPAFVPDNLGGLYVG